MKFYEALRLCVEEGKRIRRTCWSSDVFVYFRDDKLILSPVCCTFQRQRRPYECCSVDVLGDDWEIVKEKVKKIRSVWINCYRESTGAVYDTPEAAAACRKMSDFLFAKEVTYEWEEEQE